VRQQGSQWTVFVLDRSSASWTSVGNLGGAANLSLSGVAIMDLDGDRLMDVVSVSGSSIQVRKGTSTGAGTTRGAALLRPGIDPARSFIAPGATGISFPDLNGDGLADVVFQAASGLFLYLGRGDGTFEKYKDVPYPWTDTVATSQIRMGDLNRDG